MTKVLVVDDAVEAAEGLSTLFSAMGHDTRVAYDGAVAVDLARSFQPQIVFLDLDMPVLNGYQAAQAIREEGADPRPYLIALTRSQGVAVEVATRAVGFDSYMRKPADSYALIALVTDVASRLQRS